MPTLTETRPATKPITSPDPWTDRPAYAVDKASLIFGARVRHKVIPGVWKVVREAQRMDSTCRFHVRVREQAADGSLFGPVLSWTLDQVASIVGDEPKAEPVQAEAPDAVQAAPKPLVVAMVISIDGQAHDVTPIAPAPRAAKAFKFAAADGSCVVDEYPTGTSCSCRQGPSRQAALVGLACIHIRACRQLGLIAEAPEPDDARAAYDDAREAESRQVEPVRCCPSDEPMPCTGCLTHEGPGDLSDGEWLDSWRWELGPDTDPDTDPETDPEVRELIEAGGELEAEGEEPLGYATPECFRAVAEGRADWMREFGLVPMPGWVTPENRDDLMSDDAIGEGWAEPIGRDRAEAMRARRLAGPPARVDVTAGLDLADQIDDVADAYRGNGTAFGAFLSKHLEGLSDRVRFLGATTLEDYEDRYKAMLDGVRAEAEAREAAGR